MTIAAPCVVTLTNHGLRAGTGVVFTTTGALPTGITSGTTYYANSTGANTFNIYDTSVNAIAGGSTGRVTTTGSQSGTHTIKSAYYNSLSDKSRWTVSGTEYIFDGLAAWNTHRTTTVPTTLFDDEVCEIGMAFTDTTGAISLTMRANSILVTTLVNGTRSDAFHDGAVGAGYIAQANSGGGPGFSISWFNTYIDGFTVRNGSGNTGVEFSAINSGARKIIVDQNGNHAFAFSATQTYAIDCIAISGTGDGFFVRQNINALIYNCLAAKQSTYGFQIASNPVSGFYYNNISIGNTTANWGTLPTGLYSGSGNAGLVTDTTVWNTGGVPIITIATTDFANYASNDFHAAAITSPQVETGTLYPGDYAYDIADDTRPSYSGSLYNTAVTAGAFVTGLSYTIVSVGSTSFTSIGASANTVGVTFKATGAGSGTGTATLNAKYDVGPYEYDLGYGAFPLTRNLDFSGLIAGSQVVVYTTNTTTELDRDDSTGTTYTFSAGASGVTVDYTILKAGYAPIRVTGVAVNATSVPVVVQQSLDRAYSAPSGLTFGTNVIVNVTSRVVTSLQVTTSTTVQNWYSYLMDSWIASSTNTTLKNVAFPVIPFGEASFTTINGIEFSDGATSVAYLKRDGFRYSSDSGVTATAIWAAILTLDTPGGTQIKYRQATAGTIVNAANTGAMDQLVQVYGDASHGNYDYRGHMVLRAPNPGYSQPKPDLVATYGNLQDGFYVAALAPVLEYTITNADIDAAHLALDNTAKTFTITAAHTMLEIYQRAQWWANQDAQWDADIPLVTTDGSTFTQPSTWSMTGVSYLTAGTLAGGTATLAAGTQGIAYNGVTMILGAEGTYTFAMAGSCTVKTNPTADNVHYIFGSGTFNGTLTVNNLNAHPIVVEVPSGTTTSSTGNTGGAITFQSPSIYQSVTVSGITTTSRIQIYDTTSSTQLYNGVPGATSYTWTDSTPAAATRAIRVRIADVVGTAAKQFIEANIGTCATSGSGKDVSYLASQVDDNTYNDNGVDGPSIYATSGITFSDSGTDLVNCDIAGGSVQWKTIYACFVYWNFTSTGIANDFTYVDAPDTANYILAGMKIRNTSATDLMVIGGYGRDSTTGLSKDIIDTAGSTGNIFLAPDHVVPYQTTGTYAITGDISTVLAAIPSAVDTAEAVWDESLSTHTTSGTAGNVLTKASKPKISL